MAAVLMLNLAPEKRNLLLVLSIRLNFVCRDVLPGEQQCRISDLLSGTAPQTHSAGKPFRDEMLVMDGFDHDNLNFLLNEMIRTGNVIPLKAVTTPTNIRWTAAMLHHQLESENREMRIREDRI